AFFVKLLVIVGIVTQALLLGFFIACMFCHGAVLRCGNAIVSFLHKIRLVKNTEKWRGKLLGAVNKYKNSFAQIRRHRALFFIVLLLNIGQRVSQMLITCFVCRAAAPDCSFAELFAMQAFVTLGYNSIPLPGGVGAFEYLYLNIFCLRFENAFILSAMMVTRAISYYLCMAVSGVATLAYHAFLMRKKPSEAADCANGERSEKEADGATGVDASAVEKAEIASEAVEKVEIVGGEPEESE
ncbi:MAG: YbhN family protein, partial [Candidatus Gallimonas sp.]